VWRGYLAHAAARGLPLAQAAAARRRRGPPRARPRGPRAGRGDSAPLSRLPHMAAVTGELHVRGASRGAVSVDAPGLLSDALVAAKAQVMALVSAELAGEAAAGPGARRRRAL